MTKSFDLVVDGVIDALRAHVLAKSSDDFLRMCKDLTKSSDGRYAIADPLVGSTGAA